MILINDRYPKEAGIYKLTCNNNGKIYIGKAVNLFNRLTYYEKYVIKNLKDKSRLKNAIIKYGWNSFTVEILEIVKNFDKLNDNISLLERESHYINLFNSTDKDNGYNICKFSTDRTGILHTEESKRKMSKSRMGKVVSEETRAKISLSNLGRTNTVEHNERLRQLSLGNTNFLGRKHSEETKEKMSKSKLGKSILPEHKENIRKASSKRRHSEETKEKIRQSTKAAKTKFLGIKRSEETKEKIRQSMLKKKTSNIIEDNIDQNEENC